jgi:hypothetical protein
MTPDAGKPQPDDDLVRLIALDTEDLAVLSAHAQDAVVKVKDIKWLPSDGHFVVAINRFAWETTRGGSWRRRDYQRRRSALHFARVERVQSSGIDRSAADKVLALLAVRFEAGNSPSGDIVLDFAGGATIRLAVEVLEVQLTDLGPAWSTLVAPRHVFP